MATLNDKENAKYSVVVDVLGPMRTLDEVVKALPNDVIVPVIERIYELYGLDMHCGGDEW